MINELSYASQAVDILNAANPTHPLSVKNFDL